MEFSLKLTYVTFCFASEILNVITMPTCVLKIMFHFWYKRRLRDSFKYENFTSNEIYIS